MSERAICIVYTKDDPDDVLFMLPPLSRALAKDDTFTFTPVSGPSVAYKVVSVDYRIKQLASGNEHNPHDYWAASKVYYGVDVV